MPSIISSMFVALKLAALILAALVAIKLIWSGLLRPYVYFFAYLTFDVVRTSVMWGIPRRSNAYALTYFITQPIACLLFVLIVLHLYQQVLEKHKGIASLGRKALFVALIASVLLSFSSFFFEVQSGAFESMIVRDFIVFERFVMFSLLLFLVLIAAVLVYFPIPLSRNVALHAAAFGGYFLGKSYLIVFRTLHTRDMLPVVDVATQVLNVACLLVWLVFLTAEGEKVRVKVGHRWNPKDDEKLLKKLDSINDALIRERAKIKAHSEARGE